MTASWGKADAISEKADIVTLMSGLREKRTPAGVLRYVCELPRANISIIPSLVIV